jgi:hypothetical protein
LSKTVDKLTVTFYDVTEVELARRLRDKLKKKGISDNKFFKQQTEKYLESK